MGRISLNNFYIDISQEGVPGIVRVHQQTVTVSQRLVHPSLHHPGFFPLHALHNAVLVAGSPRLSSPMHQQPL